MGNVLKGYRYRIVDNRSFELPLPIKYVLLKEDNEIAEYEVLKNENVNYKIITKFKENMITPIDRPLTISDIYYFFSCRVFQDKTPFTGTELKLLGLDQYNVYDIIRKTRGITPYDNYWLRFDGDHCDYKSAKKEWDDTMSRISEPPIAQASNMPQSNADINEILNQHKVDVASKFANEAANTTPPSNTAGSNTMSESEIEALLMTSGLSAPSEQNSEKPKSSDGKMGQDEIEKMLAATTASVGESAPVEEPKLSGGKMDQDEIEKLLAATAASVGESAPVEEPKLSGGKMDQDEIEKLLAATTAAAPVEEPKPSGGKMDQDEIEKLLAATTAAAPVEETKPSGGKMDQDEIEKLLAATTASVGESAPVEEPKPSGGKMDQDEIEKLLAATTASVGESAPVEEPKPSGGKMDQDDIEKMLASVTASVEDAASEVVKNTASETVDEIVSEISSEAVSANENLTEITADAVETAASVEEPKPSGGKMNQDDIEKMLAAAADAVQKPLIDEPEQPTLDLTEQPTLEVSANDAGEKSTPAEETTLADGKPDQNEIEKMLDTATVSVGDSASETATEVVSANETLTETAADVVETATPAEKPKPSGGKMSQADIEALLSGMAEDAK